MNQSPSNNLQIEHGVQVEHGVRAAQGWFELGLAAEAEADAKIRPPMENLKAEVTGGVDTVALPAEGGTGVH